MGFKPKELTPEAERIHKRLQEDLPYFCGQELKIKLKEGGESHFVFNDAQRYLHARVEDQLRRMGKVRMFILKGRQQGVSTYIAARIYHKLTRFRGKNGFILAHIASSTETLFRIVEKFQARAASQVVPAIVTDNTKMLAFSNDSKYAVGTAGSGSIGRGDTNQYLHWSEAAFCENIDSLLTGVCQTVSDLPGTEIFIESTANGMGNYFHQGCLDALQPDSQFELVFVPWYWQREYQTPLRPHFQITEEEIALQNQYGLTLPQLQWRRDKIRSFQTKGLAASLFKQEYPCSVTEAFQFSGSSLFDALSLVSARKATLTDENAPLILGVDPGPLHDRTAISWRRGRHWIRVETFTEVGQMELAGKIASRIDKYNVSKVFIDVAEGRGCIDRLHELGYQRVVVGVPFSQRPIDDERYVNKRAEMAGRLKEWVEDEMGVRIPNLDEVEMEMGVIPAFKQSSTGKLQLPSKDDIKKVYGKSPDIVDSIMLTFAQPVKSDYNQSRIKKRSPLRRKSEITAINRRRRNTKTDDFNTDFQDLDDMFQPTKRK